MGHGSGIREVAWVDIAGGGQVVLDGNYAYVGHMQPPHGTSVLDVSDLANPRIVASIEILPGPVDPRARVGAADDYRSLQPFRSIGLSRQTSASSRNFDGVSPGLRLCRRIGG